MQHMREEREGGKIFFSCFSYLSTKSFIKMENVFYSKVTVLFTAYFIAFFFVYAFFIHFFFVLREKRDYTMLGSMDGWVVLGDDGEVIQRERKREREERREKERMKNKLFFHKCFCCCSRMDGEFFLDVILT